MSAVAAPAGSLGGRPGVETLPSPRGGRLVHRFVRQRAGVVGLVVIAGLIVVAVAGEAIAPYDWRAQDVLGRFAGISPQHWLGTDELGRDVWSRMLYGGRTDLRVGFLAVLFPFCIGTVLGCVAGYYGRWADTLVSRLVEVVVAFPFYVLIIAMVFVLGPGARNIYIAITFVGWVSYTRIIRGEILVAKRQEYVLAAQAAGFRDFRIIGRHVLPNVITQAIVFAMSDIVLDILAIVTLGYLGLGIQPPTADWGAMIADGQQFLTTHWWLSTIPGIAVVITGLGLSLIGDGLADLLRPE
jgi:peptide/nickel transport system permease protein